MKSVNRPPFNVASHQFDLSNHQPILLLAETKKLMPTVNRLAKLYQVAFPDKIPRINLNSREQILNAITTFLDLINSHHFPLHLDREIEEDETWNGHYHPWLSKIPVRPVGFATHDIEPDNYGELVALITRLGTVSAGNESPQNELLENYPEWSDCSDNFRFAHTTPILEEMNLPEPLDGLPSLIKVVLHETDTFYLDACPICGSFSGPEFEWTVENFKWFREDWRKAKPIYSKSDQLIKWTNKNQERLRAVSAILRKAHSIHMFYKDDTCPEWF